MKMESRAEQAINLIDAALAEPPVGIEEALKHAVSQGRMTGGEAIECLEAYKRARIVEGIDS